MTGQDLTGFGGSKIRKTLLLQAEKEYGMCYSIAGACSDEKERKSGLQILCFCCWMGAVHQQAPAASLLSQSTSRNVLWNLPLLKNTCLCGLLI